MTVGNFERVQGLVKSAVDVNIPNNVGDTALIRASEAGKCSFKHFELIHKINVQFSVNSKYFIEYIDYVGSYGVVQYLINNGANVSSSNLMSQAPLHAAASSGKWDNNIFGW